MVSYLSDRLQHVQLDNKKFKLERVGFGVPHGSILGPIKFYLYVTDLQATYSATTFNMQMIQRSTIIRSLVISKTVSLKQTMPLNGTMTALAIRIRYIERNQNELDYAFSTPGVSCACLTRLPSVRDLQQKTSQAILVYKGITEVHFDEHLNWNEHVLKLL